MRRLDLKVIAICCVLLASCTLCTGTNRRRRITPRPNYQSVQFHPWSRTTSAVRSVPSTFKPFRFKPSPNRVFSPHLSPPISQREGDNTIVCRNVNEIFPDPSNRSLYKICIPIGRTWFMYTYRCPNGSEFHEINRQCTVIPPTPSTTPPNSRGWTFNNPDARNGTSAAANVTNTTHIEIMPDSSVEQFESSSSSEEESSTYPPEGTLTAIRTTTMTSTTTTHEPKPLSIFIKELINQGIMKPMNSDRLAILTRLFTATTKPEVASDHENKFSTDLMLDSTPKSSSTEGAIRPDNDNVIWEESPYNIETYETTRGPLTRWKLNITDELSNVGRFPDRRKPTPTPIFT